jgi:hypothetical protein
LFNGEKQERKKGLKEAVGAAAGYLIKGGMEKSRKGGKDRKKQSE